MKTAHSIARFHQVVGESVRSITPFNVIDSVDDGVLYYDATVLISCSAMVDCRVLLGSVSCLQSSRMMGNGLYDEFRWGRM